jgi:hypothetical protein
MLHKKKIVLSRPKPLFNMRNLLEAVNNFRDCLSMKCNIEQNQYYRNKNIIKMENSISDFRYNLKNGKADFSKFNNEIAKLKSIVMKEKERKILVNSELKHCYNETSQLLRLTIENILHNGDKKTKIYNNALQYKKLLEKNKITAKHLNNIETDLTLTSEYINLIETELLKLQMKMMKMNRM